MDLGPQRPMRPQFQEHQFPIPGWCWFIKYYSFFAGKAFRWLMKLAQGLKWTYISSYKLIRIIKKVVQYVTKTYLFSFCMHANNILFSYNAYVSWCIHITVQLVVATFGYLSGVHAFEWKKHSCINHFLWINSISICYTSLNQNTSKQL